jgi:hypothetical protein
MRSEIEAMLGLAGLAAGCAERPASAADGAQGKEAPRMDQATNGRGRRNAVGHEVVLDRLDHSKTPHGSSALKQKGSSPGAFP